MYVRGYLQGSENDRVVTIGKMVRGPARAMERTTNLSIMFLKFVDIC